MGTEIVTATGVLHVELLGYQVSRFLQQINCNVWLSV